MSGQEIGTFLSERIKVISKPSKKKQQMKNNECSYLCITSGKKVSIVFGFKPCLSRLLCSTVFAPKPSLPDICTLPIKNFEPALPNGAPSLFIWVYSKIDAVLITCLVDEVKSPVDTHDFHTKDGYIYYGAVVKLVDTNSGISLPRLVSSNLI